MKTDTYELLLRLGFIGSFEGDSGYWRYSFKAEYGHSLGDFSISHYDSVQWKIWRSDRYCGIFKLEFVHELQNLFFVFNQMELQLKESPIKVINGTKSKFFQKALEEAKKAKTMKSKSILDEILDTITPSQQRATDVRMIIAAKLGDKIGVDDGLFLIGQIANKLDITYSDCLTWLSGTHDFTVSEIIKIEEFLGEKLINIE